jgi:hypothetical protein
LLNGEVRSVSQKMDWQWSTRHHTKPGSTSVLNPVLTTA